MMINLQDQENVNKFYRDRKNVEDDKWQFFMR